MRDDLGMCAGTEVEIERVEDHLIVRKAGAVPIQRRRRVERLRGRGDVEMTTDEIMDLTRCKVE